MSTSTPKDAKEALRSSMHDTLDYIRARRQNELPRPTISLEQVAQVGIATTSILEQRQQEAHTKLLNLVEGMKATHESHAQEEAQRLEELRQRLQSLQSAGREVDAKCDQMKENLQKQSAQRSDLKQKVEGLRHNLQEAKLVSPYEAVATEMRTVHFHLNFPQGNS